MHAQTTPTAQIKPAKIRQHTSQGLSLYLAIALSVEEIFYGGNFLWSKLCVEGTVAAAAAAQ